MRTGDHILHSETLPDGIRAWCSCGNARWRGVPDIATARVLHGTHFDTVVNDALDAAEQAVRS